MSAAPRSKKPNSSTNSASSLTSYRKAYIQADSFCREVQNFEDQAGIPSMNEMRYAGHHLLVALDDDGRITDQEQLIKALNHTKRACYEASEAGILTALTKIKNFKETYSKVIIGDIIRNYSDILNAAAEAQGIIETRNHNIEDDGNPENVNRIIESYAHDSNIYMEAFRGLKKHCHTLDLHRDELNKRVQDNKDKIENDRKEARRFFLTMWIAVPGIVLGALTLLVAYLAWVKPHEPQPDHPIPTVGTPPGVSSSGESAS